MNNMDNLPHLILEVDNNTTYIKGRMESSVYNRFKKEMGYISENSFWMIKILNNFFIHFFSIFFNCLIIIYENVRIKT